MGKSKQSSDMTISKRIKMKIKTRQAGCDFSYRRNDLQHSL